MTERTARNLAVLSMLAAVAAALLLWMWQISFDHPRLVGRPHWLMWDIVSHSLRQDGAVTLDSVSVPDDHPLLQYGAWFFRHFGRDFRAMAAAQIPFLVLLLISAGIAAWRVAGPLGGGIAPWVALFAPMTLGMTTQFDDLLAMQAFIMFALALLFWSDKPRWLWLAFAAAVLFAKGVRMRIWYTTELWAVIVMVGGVSAWLAWAWIARSRNRIVNVEEESNARMRMFFAVFLFLLILSTLGPGLNMNYLMGQNYRSVMRGKSLWTVPEAIWLTPAFWVQSFLRPMMSLALVPALIGAWVYGKRRDLLAFLCGCVLVPTVLLMFVNKRQEFYLAGAVEPLYVLIAAGIAEFLRRRRAVLVGVAVLALIAGGWFWEVRDRGPDPSAYNLSDHYWVAFEHTPTYYLVSPRAPGDRWEILGDLVARECSAKKLPAVFVEDVPINGPVAFYAWHADPGSRFGDVYRGPLPAPPWCLVFQSFSYRGYYRTLKQVMEDLYLNLNDAEKNARTAFPEVRARLDEVDKVQKDCTLAASKETWSIYRCEPPEAIDLLSP